MKRQINLPLWFAIIVVTLLAYDSFVVPFIGELNRQNAVTNINNPSTDEHNTLAEFMADTFRDVVSAGRQERELEHNILLNETQIIKNNTHTIILMLQNGTD